MTKCVFNCIWAMCLLVMTSCKKGASPEPHETSSGNVAMVLKINSWLEKQKHLVEGRHNEKINALMQHLDFTRLFVRQKNSREKFVTIPLKRGYVTENNKGKNPVSSLLLMLNEQDEIIRANVVQYLPARIGQTVLPGSVSEVFLPGKIIADGRYTVLNLVDQYRYELQFEAGKLVSYSSMKAETKNDPQRSEKECTDWWLVRTYVYADGHTEKEVIYLGQTCGCDMVGPGGGMICDELETEGGGMDLEPEYTSIESASGIASTSLGDAIYDQGNGSYRMNVAWEWKCGKGSTLILSNIYNWEYYSYETGILRKTNLNDPWLIHTFQHSSIQLIGLTPPTHVYSLSLAYQLPSINTDMRSAEMNLKYVVFESIATKNQTKSWTVYASKTCVAP